MKGFAHLLAIGIGDEGLKTAELEQHRWHGTYILSPTREGFAEKSNARLHYRRSYCTLVAGRHPAVQLIHFLFFVVLLTILCLAFMLLNVTVDVSAVEKFLHLSNLAVGIKSDKVHELQDVGAT